jgi:predicted PurR-regulated permease PerM
VLYKFLVACAIFLVLVVVLLIAGVPYAGLIALAGGIIAFIVAPGRTNIT